MPNEKIKKVFVDIRRAEKPKPPLPPAAPMPIAPSEFSGNSGPAPATVISMAPIPVLVQSYGQPLPKKPLNREKSQWRRLRMAFSAVAILATGTVAIGAVGFFNLKDSFAQSAETIAGHFKNAAKSLANLETQNAKTSFADADLEINSIKSRANSYGLFEISQFWGLLVPKLKTISKSFTDLTKLSATALDFTVRVENLQNSGFQWFTNQQGKLIAENLDGLKNNLAAMADLSAGLKNQSSSLGYQPNGSGFTDFNDDLYSGERFLNAFADWFKSAGDKHFLILFQNPSELRPAGGFLGSYADLTLNQNGLREIKIWDIYDPDGQLSINIIPPKQLQAVTAKWGARDANWFFDFPTSAKKVIDFLELSKIYSERSITFDGALAINVEFLKTLLSITGPIELPQYRLTVNSENFMPEIQKEVEAGADKTAGEPKRILKILMPMLLQKIAGLTADQKVLLTKTIKNQLGKRDIMIFFKDWAIENYLQNQNLGGAVMNLPDNFRGDYLAVVNTNVAGGKSDAFIEQKIKLSSKIEPDGRINNYLVVEKTHSGQNQKEWWYKTTNKSYLKIFTPRGSRLTYISGQTAKSITPLVDYGDTGYLTDPDLKNIEDTDQYIKAFNAHQTEESDKTVFAFWFNVVAGASKKFEVQYYNPIKLNLRGNAAPYQFIFERQSGASAKLDFLIEAPTGYIWQENGQPAFNYVNDDPPGRLILNLTLVPDQQANQR